MSNHEIYMQRCFELARKGSKNIKSNPNVGSVIVYQDQIIGEGYHQVYGGPHAEINALNSVKAADKKHFSNSTIYVSLEPCFHTGKTPPCVNAILSQGIPKVVISCIDPNPKVSGQSIAKLKESGVEVITDILEKEGQELIRPFKVMATGRPYITLKYAQSKDAYLGQTGKRIHLSNEYSNVFVHKLRSQVDGILIGVNTANIDNPKLTTRHYPGESPTPIILDPNNRIDRSLDLLRSQNQFWHITSDPSIQNKNHIYISKEQFTIDHITKVLLTKGIFRLLVEGGKYTLDSFIKAKIWDDAYIITAPRKLVSGIKAPTIIGHKRTEQIIGKDKLVHILNIEYQSK